jgi:hypothetical protein
MLRRHNGIQFRNEVRIPPPPFTARLLGTAHGLESCAGLELSLSLLLLFLSVIIPQLR